MFIKLHNHNNFTFKFRNSSRGEKKDLVDVYPTIHKFFIKGQLFKLTCNFQRAILFDLRPLKLATCYPSEVINSLWDTSIKPFLRYLRRFERRICSRK